MKGSIILFEKNGVLIRTQYISSDEVAWTEDKKKVGELLAADFQIVRKNKVDAALADLENLRESLCCGYKVKNGDLIDIIKKLREY